MIDLSKAFGEINHDVMIDKLLKSSLPKIVVRTIGHMLKNILTLHERFIVSPLFHL